MIKLIKYKAVRMHPKAKKIAPIQIFIELFNVISRFLKNEKKNRKGTREKMIKIKFKSMIEILKINKIRIIGKRRKPT